MTYLKTTERSGYQIVQIDRPKVNALNHEVIEALREAVRACEKDTKYRGLILTGQPGIFSAGLDVIELYDYSEAKIRDFMISFSRLHLELVNFPKALICALGGHSPAGGTVIALGADYRVMAEGEHFGIGLNEVAVHVQIPHNLVTAYAFWLGRGPAHRYIMAGKLLSPQEALRAGLVDEVVPVDQVLERAEIQMQGYLAADPNIWLNTKVKVRAPWREQLDYSENLEELNQALEVWWSPNVRTQMGAYVDYLKTKKKN